MKRIWIALFIIVVAGTTRSAHAQDSAAPKPEAAPEASSQATPERPAAILKAPDYSGDLWHRPYLTGDWGGARTSLADKGVLIDLRWNQYVQGVVEGGRDTSTRYGGKGDYLVNLDLQRMGVLPGALIKFRAESRYGDSINSQAGPILPVNTDAFFPLTDKLDESIPFTITDLNYTQFLSEKFGVFLGKLDTLDGDANEFASGRGTSQFMNSNLVFNPALALRLPYSTLGGGLVWLPNSHITVVTSLVNTVDSSTTTGFEDFGDGMSWTTEASFQYKLGDLPGGENVGFLYSFDQDFTRIGGRVVFQPGQGLTPQTEKETWAAYWSGWQYVYVKDPSDAPINLTNGQPDHEGLGVFSRFGFADKDTNPVEWAFSGGVGGRGLIPSRDNDTFGLGYFYNSIQTTRFSGIVGIKDQAQGVEAFYNIAITPAAQVTLDVQYVEPPASGLDNAWLLGMRMGLKF